MAEGGEMGGFIFAISFILIFGTLIAAMPVGLQGPGGTASELLPVDPNLITDFSDIENFTKTDFTADEYHYDDLGGFDWVCWQDVSDDFAVSRKVKIAGILWLGGLKHTNFVLSNGTNRGWKLTLDEIQGDAEDGAVRYNLEYQDSGNSAGGFIFYWNETLYPDPADAWDADVLYLAHGVGIDSTAAGNIFTLLLNLLFFQLPDVPVLLNVLIATPFWACIVYLIWFAVTKTLPLIG